MDLFPTLLEEYDLTGAPGVDEFHNHVNKKLGKKCLSLPEAIDLYK